MGRRCLGIVVCVVILGACGSSANPASGQASGTPAPTAVPGTTRPSSQATIPAGSGPAAQVAVFGAHYMAQYAVIAALMDKLGTHAAVSDAAAVAKDVADIHAWSKAETVWMTANPPAACYAGVQNYWDIGRTHADKAATVAQGGDWDQVEVNFAIDTFKKIAGLLASVPC